jgi:hypothetical protein
MNSTKPRLRLAACMPGLLLILAGCGGGGGGGGDSNAATAGSSPAAAPASTPAAPSQPASTPQSATPSGPTVQDGTTLAANAVSVVVNPGPASTVNVPFTSITLCMPGGSQCQTIDHIIVDTGSSGLRIFASQFSAAASLPPQASTSTASTASTAGAGALAECAQFADSSVWGPIRLADVQIGGERAASMAIQIMADPQFAAVPSPCASTGPVATTVQAFGANGILGVGPQRTDCGSTCEQNAVSGVYYGCNGASCQPVAVPVAQQVQNPVTRFAVNNNGVLLKFPALPAGGAASVTGTMVFGIGTAANNGLGNATVYTISSDTGTFSTDYKGTSFPRAFIDSGSNGYFFNDASIPNCGTGFYCPATTLALSAVNRGLNNASGTVNFSVANANSFFSTGNAATDALGGSGLSSRMFDWGLPFFFGRSVFTAIEGAATPAGAGPYFAY